MGLCGCVGPSRPHAYSPVPVAQAWLRPGEPGEPSLLPLPFSAVGSSPPTPRMAVDRSSSWERSGTSWDLPREVDAHTETRSRADPSVSVRGSADPSTPPVLCTHVQTRPAYIREHTGTRGQGPLPPAPARVALTQTQPDPHGHVSPPKPTGRCTHVTVPAAWKDPQACLHVCTCTPACPYTRTHVHTRTVLGL